MPRRPSPTAPPRRTRYADALEAAEAADLWTLDARRDELLDGLGVGTLPLDRPIGEVSGGQRSRVALAALLLARPDALLLDEPTNHLDDAAVAFLVSRLRDWRGAVVFASHDRAFLDDVATELIDIDPCAVGHHPLRRRLHRLPGREGGRARAVGGAVRRRGEGARAARARGGRDLTRRRARSRSDRQRQVPARLQEGNRAEADLAARAQRAGAPRRSRGRTTSTSRRPCSASPASRAGRTCWTTTSRCSRSIGHGSATGCRSTR